MEDKVASLELELGRTNRSIMEQCTLVEELKQKLAMAEIAWVVQCNRRAWLISLIVDINGSRETQ